MSLDTIATVAIRCMFAAAGIGIGVALLILITRNRHLLTLRRTARYDRVTFEVTPFVGDAVTALSTSVFYAALHHIDANSSISTIDFQLVASSEAGIRYFITVDKPRSSVVRQSIHAYLPGATIDIVDEVTVSERAVVFEAQQTAHYRFPLQTDYIDTEDPIQLLLQQCSHLAPEESIHLCLSINPMNGAQAGQYVRRLSRHDLELMSDDHSVGMKIVGRVSDALMGAADLFAEVVSPTTPQYDQTRQADKRHRHAAAQKQVLTQAWSVNEEAVAEQMISKLTQPLFLAYLTVKLVAPRDAAHQRLHHVVTQWLNRYANPPLQSIILAPASRSKVAHRAQTKRTDSPKYRLILSSEEVGALFHIPDQRQSRHASLSSHLTHEIPLPLAFRQRNKEGATIGLNRVHGIELPVKITDEVHERHMFIVGGTGNGKTTMLQSMITADFSTQTAVSVIDPHGDMAEMLLGLVPPERRDDVIYFNPDDITYPIGLNLLELTPGLEGDELIREKDLVTEAVVSLFRKIFSSDDSGGHRIEYILRNAIHTALTQPDATLFTVYDLLNNPKYRQRVVQTIDNKDLKMFWEYEFSMAGGYQKVKMISGITAKIGRFLFSASAKRMLEQPRSTINFDEVIDSKILIANLSKGRLGEDTSELFGIALLTKLQLAALRRARRPQAQRQPCHVYVDEFQNFATPSFVQLLSEARKYKLFLTMAEQTTSQQADRDMVGIIFANVGTVVAFRSANPMDEQVLLPLLAPSVEPGQLAQLPTYHFYIRMHHATPQPAFSGETIVIDTHSDDVVRQAIIEHSRHTYGRKFIRLQESKVARQKKGKRADSSGRTARAVPTAFNEKIT